MGTGRTAGPRPLPEFFGAAPNAVLLGPPAYGLHSPGPCAPPPPPRLSPADFGLSICTHHERPVTRAGTLDFMAPEVGWLGGMRLARQGGGAARACDSQLLASGLHVECAAASWILPPRTNALPCRLPKKQPLARPHALPLHPPPQVLVCPDKKLPGDNKDKAAVLGYGGGADVWCARWLRARRPASAGWAPAAAGERRPNVLRSHSLVASFLPLRPTVMPALPPPPPRAPPLLWAPLRQGVRRACLRADRGALPL